MSVTRAEFDALAARVAVLEGGPKTEPPLPPATLPGVQAFQADHLPAVFGVNVHAHDGNQTYTAGDAWTRSLDALAELGCRTIRDGATLAPGFVARMRAAFARGIQLAAIREPADSGDWTYTSGGFADFVGVIGPANLAFVEGVNEPDLGTWAGRVSAHRGMSKEEAAVWYQRDTWTTASRAGVLVAAPSITDAAMVGRYPVGEFCDFGNVHHYLSGRHPETGGWGSDGYGSADWARRMFVRPMVGNRPYCVTEWGYHNSLAAGGHRGAPESVAAKYLPRALMGIVAGGNVYSACLYELRDGGRDPANLEHNFGLLRADGSKKPAFHALRSLLQAYNDPGPAFAPRKLDYRIPNAPASLRTTLAQKRDGSWLLATWLAEPVWEPDAQRVVAVPEREIRIELPPTIKRAELLVPGEDAAWSAKTIGAGGVLTTNARDRLSILRLRP
jgi:hypothetical protein